MTLEECLGFGSGCGNVGCGEENEWVVMVLIQWYSGGEGQQNSDGG